MSSRNARPNNAEVVDRCSRRLRALRAHVPRDARIDMDGTAHDARSVEAIYQRSLDVRAEVTQIRAMLLEAIARRTEAEAARRAADRALKPWVVNRFGERSAEALTFGFPPPREYHRTTDEKAHAVALAKATRKARWTMGSRQREEVRGELPKDVATPASPDLAPASPPLAGRANVRHLV